MTTDEINTIAEETRKMRWPSDTPGKAAYDWYEFSIRGDDEKHGELLRVRVNVSFLTSTWKCIFGQGCPGVLVSGAMEDRGCCQIGVHMEHTDDDYKRVRSYVEQLTEEDLDENLLRIVRKKGWRYRDTSNDGESALEDYPWHTKVVDGACVLANRAGGSTGKLGCSLHVLANRLGLHHSDTKPNICWQIPLSVTEDYDDEADQTTMTVTGTPASVWGSTDPKALDSPGWWCTETPDAYVIGNAENPIEKDTWRGMVFATNEVELRKIMGDKPYEVMAEHLMAIIAKGGRREPMPGETIAGGRPLLPLLVGARLEQWVDDETPESMEALERSQPYMRTHDAVPDGYRLPKALRRPKTIAVEANKVSADGDTIETEVPAPEPMTKEKIADLYEVPHEVVFTPPAE